jgi:hypothetical protein
MSSLTVGACDGFLFGFELCPPLRLGLVLVFFVRVGGERICELVPE